jgi:pimeloyl-ACP methyl ester carboxylesterase
LDVVPEELSVDVAGVPTQLFRAGEGPPLVYLHGVAPSGEWLHLYSLLAREFTVYVPDHPGFGRTERPEWLEGMDDLVLHYEELFRILGLERPAVVGFSLGGWLGAELAVTYPDLIGALVLLNAAGLHRDEALIPDLAALKGEALSQTVFHDPIAAEAYFTQRRRPAERMKLYRGMTTAALLAWNPWFDPKLERRLRRISVPTLALWAEHDRLIPPLYGEVYHQAIAGSKLEILPVCGHMAPVERPEAVADAVLSFLRPVSR